MLTCDTVAQAEARSGQDGHNKGAEAAAAALRQIDTARRLGARLMARPPKTRTRTASRVAAVQALFQAEQAGDNPETVIDQFVRHRLGDLAGQDGFEDGRIPDAEVPLFARVVREAVRRQAAIDPLLSDALPDDWPLARLDPVLRALIRAGAAELTMAEGRRRKW